MILASRDIKSSCMGEMEGTGTGTGTGMRVKGMQRRVKGLG